MRYPELLAEVHRGLAERFGIAPDAEAAAAFGASVGDWPAFADSAEALAYLKQHYQLVILSNVDRASFARSNAKLGVDVRCGLHRRGHRLLQAGPAQFRLPAAPPGRAGHRQGADPAHGRIALPRPHPGQAHRARDLLDPSPRRQAGPWCDARAGRRGPARFPVREPGCDGGGAPRRARRLALASAALELAADLDDGPVQLVLDRRVADRRAAGDRLEAGAGAARGRSSSSCR